MPNYNRVTLVGHLTRDPELRYIPSGTPVCDFGLAVNSGYGDNEEVCFIDITTWSKTAENCAKYLAKGQAVLVDGRIKYDIWETDEGQKRSKHSVTARQVVFLGGKKQDGDDNIPF